jgi:adenosylcobinamide-phosphate synthase
VRELFQALAPEPVALLFAVVTDLAIGDPVYAWHPIRLIGGALQWTERRLRAAGFDGNGGGVLLFLALSACALAALVVIMAAAIVLSSTLGWIVHVVVLYVLLALGDLLHHVWRIESALRRGDLATARQVIGLLVGRDVDRMDAAACRRAAVESLSENLTDGFVSPVIWYAVAGLPGVLVFKVVSTMDSMVGYKTPQYLHFGWCGARLDDVMNYVPARLTWLAIVMVGGVLPRLSGLKAWRVGLAQHQQLPGPNSGWSEAAAAGALQRRLVGPIWRDGVQVTDLWIGDPLDPPLAESTDVTRAMLLVSLSGWAVTALAAAALAVV